jgi:hypothetical protein
VQATYLKWIVCLSFCPNLSANLEEEKERQLEFILNFSLVF